jgi:DnaJ-class molecular chaperone
MSDLYKTLGIDRNASESDIKKAFRKQSLQYHPDKNADKSGAELEEVTNKFKAANEAYEILSDKEKRQQYDMHGMNAFQNNGGGMHQEFHDINQVFNMMFGGGMSGMPGMHGMPGGGIHVFHSNNGSPFGGGFQQFFRHIEKPQAIVKNIQITMHQMYNGASIPVEIEAIVVHNNIQSTEIKTIMVEIPAGVNENEVILLENKGHNVNNEAYGDIKIVIILKNKTKFIREGMDIIYNKTITLKEALCGFSFEFKHLNEKNLSINNMNQTVIKPNYKKIIPNLGFMRNGQIGNLVIIFSIDFPDTLSNDQIAELKDIL